MFDKYLRECMVKVLQQRGSQHNNWYCMRHWYWRWFYTLKAVICMTLDREPKRKIDWQDDYIDCMAVVDGGKSFGGEYTSYWCEHVSVGLGVFKNWYYFISSDSSD